MSLNKSKKPKLDQHFSTPGEISQVGFPYSSRNWKASFVDPQAQNMLQFEDYCKFRSSMQMQLLIDNRQTKVFGADDQMFAGLILMEQQWQYSRRISSLPSSENGPFGNPSFNQNLQEYSTSFGKENPLKQKGLKPIQKKKIKKYEGKPKKPLTSFMLFLRDFRKTLIASKPITEKASPHEINKLAGKQWHLLPENIKLQYKKEASNSLARWRKENFPLEMKDCQSSTIQIHTSSNENAPLSTSDVKIEKTNDSVSNKRLSSSTTSASSSASDSSSGDSSGSESACSSA